MVTKFADLEANVQELFENILALETLVYGGIDNDLAETMLNLAYEILDEKNLTDKYVDYTMERLYA